MLKTVFTQSTKLKPAQINTLIKLLDEYDDPEYVAYEVIGQLNSGTTFTSIKKDLADGRDNWKMSFFKELKNVRDERDERLENPIEIREGEMECPKCHTTKTLVVPMQTRSADEGTTYYIVCMNPTCKKVTK